MSERVIDESILAVSRRSRLMDRHVEVNDRAAIF
jgi:hypothetical protein